MKDAIFFFKADDPYFEFSNAAPFGFEECGVYWPSVEHYFQAMKFTGDEHADLREKIRHAETPRKAKQVGTDRENPLRSDWSDVKEDVMLHALKRKFSNPKLRDLLAGTGDAVLCEDAPHDNYWGTGKNGTGENRLGKLLMQLRDELMAVSMNRK